MTSVRTAAMALATLLTLGAACGSPRPVEHPLPPPAPSATPTRDVLFDSRAVAFRTADRVRLEGRLFGDGRHGVLLMHAYDADQSEWFDVAAALAKQGYLVLTFNFRGYCPGAGAGCSEGKRFQHLDADARTAVTYLRAHGARTVAQVGADLGGYAILAEANRGELEADAVVVISVQEQFIENVEEIAPRVRPPKLFMAGRYDSLGALAAQDFFDWAKPPKELKVFATDARGSDLFRETRAGAAAKAATDALFDFLSRYA